MKRLQYQEHVGKVTWFLKEDKNDACSMSGMHDCWSDRNATPEQLIAASSRYERDRYTYAYCDEWQVVTGIRSGNKRKSSWVTTVMIKAYEKRNGKWVSI